jgi:hypothetical protein
VQERRERSVGAHYQLARWMWVGGGVLLGYAITMSWQLNLEGARYVNCDAINVNHLELTNV